MTPTLASAIVLNFEELGPDPALRMDLAVKLDANAWDIRSAEGINGVLFSTHWLRRNRCLADTHGLRVAALASPQWEKKLPGSASGRVDTLGFATQVPVGEQPGHVQRALEAATIRASRPERVFSHLKVGELVEPFADDPLLSQALALDAQTGVRLLIKGEPVGTVADRAVMLAVLESFHKAGLGLWLDLGNLHEAGQADLATIEALTPYTHYIHIKDYQAANGSHQFCAAGTGDVPYSHLLSHLGSLRPLLLSAPETHVRDTPAETLTTGAAYPHITLARALP